MTPVRSDEGYVTGHARRPRRFKLSYLVTAWTQRPEDEHRLLAACLAALIRHDALPAGRDGRGARRAAACRRS